MRCWKKGKSLNILRTLIRYTRALRVSIRISRFAKDEIYEIGPDFIKVADAPTPARVKRIYCCDYEHPNFPDRCLPSVYLLLYATRMFRA